MTMEKQFVVYILANKRRTTLYTGVTSHLPTRLQQHRDGKAGSFTTRYNIDQLVYIEPCDTAIQAIEREKQIKGGSRADKIALIESLNKEWRDLSSDL
jgi:putative endonuclease